MYIRHQKQSGIHYLCLRLKAKDLQTLELSLLSMCFCSINEGRLDQSKTDVHTNTHMPVWLKSKGQNEKVTAVRKTHPAVQLFGCGFCTVRLFFLYNINKKKYLNVL